MRTSRPRPLTERTSQCQLVGPIVPSERAKPVMLLRVIDPLQQGHCPPDEPRRPASPASDRFAATVVHFRLVTKPGGRACDTGALRPVRTIWRIARLLCGSNLSGNGGRSTISSHVAYNGNARPGGRVAMA